MTTIYLYVKTHSKTGLKYFGKTTKDDPHKYLGSGLYWRKHLKKHGKDYETEIIAEFQDEILCQEFAINFSKENNIVESNEWANLQEENGLDGAPLNHRPHKFTREQLQKMSESSRERWQDPTYREKLSKAQSKSWTNERREEQSKRLKGHKRPEHSALMKSRPIPENFKCHKKTEEHKKAISRALKSKKKSEDHKENIRKALEKKTPEEWEQRKQNRRANSNYKFEIDGVAYVSLRQASEDLGISTYKVRKLITRWI